ncbi:MAG: methyltransferase domain-containing protein [Candidatus Gracilibacteria bacterium]|nr:methyltransferase domain-containing protein [Candidatus Gracilibacteria bacterium]
MSKYYNSEFYSKAIEVANIEGEILVIITDDKGREIIYTWYDIEEKTSQSVYINKCLLGGFIKKIPENVLIIGFGGGAFAKYLEDHIKNINITGIDIDKTMFEIAKKELFVKSDNFIVSDALLALKELVKNNLKYDLVLLDIYGGDGEVPDYIKDIEFFEYVKSVLKDDGVVSVNFADYYIGNLKHDKTHENLVNIFGKNFSQFLAGTNDRGNVIGIYNLDKKYSSDDYINKYTEHVQKGRISFDENIIAGF